MIEKKRHMPHIQSNMTNMQHVKESEAPAGQTVAITRIPPGAVIQAGQLEVREAFAAGTVKPVFVPEDGGAKVELHATTISLTATGFSDYVQNLPLYTASGGWIKGEFAATTGADGGDAIFDTEYKVDGRWTEVMPEQGVYPADHAT